MTCDKLGRRVRRALSLGQVTSYTYDELGNPLTQTDANTHTTSFAYDQLGRRTRRTLPLGQSETYGYDSAGNLTAKIDFNGRTTTYQYDPNNNWLKKKIPDAAFGTASTVSFTYTPVGRRQTMADISGTTTWIYDQRDRVTSKITPEGTLSYTYDKAGDPLTIRSNAKNAGFEVHILPRMFAPKARC